LNKRVANVLGKSQKPKKSLNNINGASAPPPPVVDSKINGASVETTMKTTSIETNNTEESKKDETKMVITPEPILDPTTPPEPPTTPKNYAYTQGHLHEFAPKLVVVGVGGAGGNAVNNMIAHQLSGVDFLALNTDAQHLSTTLTDNRLQIGSHLTSGLGCGANPDAGRLAAEESREEITELLGDAHMVFITAGMVCVLFFVFYDVFVVVCCVSLLDILDILYIDYIIILTVCSLYFFTIKNKRPTLYHHISPFPIFKIKGGGTGTGAAPVEAEVCYNLNTHSRSSYKTIPIRRNTPNETCQ